MKRHCLPVVALLALLVAGCATETSRTVETPAVASARTAYSGVQVPVAVGKFENRSNYLSGLFSDGVDRLVTDRPNGAGDDRVNGARRTW